MPVWLLLSWCADDDAVPRVARTFSPCSFRLADKLLLQPPAREATFGRYAQRVEQRASGQ